VWIGSVLRSWEDRFSARLLNVGPGAEIRLLVERPPRTRGTAEKIAPPDREFPGRRVILDLLVGLMRDGTTAAGQIGQISEAASAQLRWTAGGGLTSAMARHVARVSWLITSSGPLIKPGRV
jgi:hypothetical protein